MAPSKDAAVPDFGAFIKEAREKKRNQTLAQEIFGNKGRRASAPGAASNKKPAIGGSLASRVGVQKRSNSSARSSPRPSPRPTAGNVNAEWTHDLHSLNNPPSSSSSRNNNPPRGPRASNPSNNHTDRLRNALSRTTSSPTLSNQFNIVGTSKPASSSSISIRGTATGPFCVVAKNLAPGTTVADIESAMAPMGGVVLSSVIIVERPKVIAEIVFESREGAENVVETFNNQNADGNILHVYHKQGAISSAHKLPASTSQNNNNNNRDRNIDTRSRRDEIIDGSQGFEDRMDTDDNDNRGGLYSDNLVNNRGRGRGNSRERGRGGGKDRGRGYR